MPQNFKDKIEFVENLVQKKGWEIEKPVLLKAFQRPKFRFVHFDVRLKKGKRAFFKLAPTSKLLKRLIREREFLLFLNKNLLGICPKVLDFGPSWLLSEFLEGGVICPERDETSALKLDWIEPLVSALDRLQKLDGEIPETLLRLSCHSHNYADIEGNKKIILGINRFLKKYKSMMAYPFSEIERFLSGLPKQKEGKRVLVHGDFAPDNVFFGQGGSRVVLLDWEYAGYNPNLTLGRAYDFANFYLLCWRNPSFQKALKECYLEKKMARNDELALAVIFQAGVQLSAICSFGKETGVYLKRHIKCFTDLIRETLEFV